MKPDRAAAGGVTDRRLLAALPQRWWAGQLGWQLLETSARLGFVCLLATLAATLLTSGHAPPGTHWLAAIGALLLRWLGHQGQARHAQRASERALARLHLNALSGAAAPQRQTGAGDQAGNATVINQQLERVAPYWQAFLPALLAACWQPLVVVVLVATADWLAALLLVLCAPLIPGFAVLIGMGSARISRQEHQRLQRLGGLFFDRISALPTIRLMDAALRTQSQLKRGAEGLKDSTLRVLRVAFLSSAVLEFFAAVSIAALAMYIGLALLGAIAWGPADQMTLQRGLIVLLLAPEFFAPLRTLAQRYHERSDARSAAVEPFQLSQTATAGQAVDSPGAPPRVSLHDLALRWPGSHSDVLSGLRLSIPQGQWLTIHGASGCGKTTLAYAMAGQLAWHGELRLGGRAVTPNELRGQVAWVDQQPSLFNASLRRNLSPGDRSPDPDRLARVLEQTGLTDLVASLPQGLDTRLGSKGVALSGGQTQRLAIARALLPGARWLVLDEPTAQLDLEAEAALLAVLRGLAGSHTITLFAHSPRARQLADRHLALEQLYAA